MLKVEPNGRGMYRVIFSGTGGSVPKALRGNYTSFAAAEEAIKVFQAGVRGSADVKYPKAREKADAKGEAGVQ